jgi:phosphoribosylformylglycinamidine synthase
VLVGARDAGMGGSAYADAMGSEAAGGGTRDANGSATSASPATGGRVPRVDLAVLPRTLDAVHAAIVGGHVASCHDVSEGGLLACAAEMGFGGDLGVALDLAGLVAGGESVAQALGAETAGAFLVELEEGADPAVLFGGADDPADEGVPWVNVGRSTAERTLVAANGAADVFAVELADLQEAWERPMRAVFH